MGHDLRTKRHILPIPSNPGRTSGTARKETRGSSVAKLRRTSAVTSAAYGTISFITRKIAVKLHEWAYHTFSASEEARDEMSWEYCRRGGREIDDVVVGGWKCVKRERSGVAELFLPCRRNNQHDDDKHEHECISVNDILDELSRHSYHCTVYYAFC